MTTVTLSERAQEIVERQLACGTYEDAAQVVERALALLQHQDDLFWADVREKVEVGRQAVREGRVQEWHPGIIDEIIAEADALRQHEG